MILYLLYILYTVHVYIWVVGSFDEHMKNNEIIGIKPTISSLLNLICQKKNVTGHCTAFQWRSARSLCYPTVWHGIWEMGTDRDLDIGNARGAMCCAQLVDSLFTISMQTRMDVLASSLLFQVGKLYHFICSVEAWCCFWEAYYIYAVCTLWKVESSNSQP